MSPFYQIQRLPNDPILLIELLPEYSIARDMDKSAEAIRALLDTASEPLYYVLDLTQITVSLDDLLLSTTKGARGSTPLWHHPMIKKIVFVSPSPMIQQACQGMNSRVFGNLEAVAFGTLDEALNYCRA